MDGGECAGEAQEPVRAGRTIERGGLDGFERGREESGDEPEQEDKECAE